MTNFVIGFIIGSLSGFGLSCILWFLVDTYSNKEEEEEDE